jgi:hypothetical protein
LPAIALALTIGGTVTAGGGYVGQLRDHDRRIVELETDGKSDARAKAEVLQQLDLRLARIEVKLEMMSTAKDHRP